jgi:Protein of unknown function (DUF3631)
MPPDSRSRPGPEDPATDQNPRSHKSYPQGNPSEQSSKIDPARAHFDAVFGDQNGWVFIGTGTDQYVTDSGKVAHGHWAERSFRWPDQAEEIVAFITEQDEAGADVYFTPSLSSNPVRKKTKNPKHSRRPLPVHALWSDLDDNWSGLRVGELHGRFLVYSSEHRRHLYVPLVEPAAPDIAEDLLRRLAAYVGGDPAVTWHGAYLRPVGTKNWKPTTLTGEPPSKVEFALEPSEPRWTVDALDDLLPPVEHSTPTAEGPAAEPVDGLPAELEEIISEPVTVGMDRSVRTMAAVGACTRAGLTDGQIITAMRQHQPTVEKYDGRADAEVARVIGKVRAQEPATIGAPVAKKQLIVDGDKLLDELRNQLTCYVAFPSAEAADAVTLYVTATHAQTAWEHATRLVIKSPVRRCGKTRLLEVLQELCENVLATANCSVAALTRSIGIVDPPTIVLDEADSVFATRRGERSESAEDLRGILNAGHARGWPYLRWDPAKRQREECPTFAMAVIAGIGDMPDTIEDRAVVVTMRRRAPGEQVTRFRRRRSIPPLRDLRDRLHEWIAGHADELADAEPDLPVEDRAADCWEPLVAVADLAGGDWPARARRACKALARGDVDDEADGTRLLTDLHAIYDGADRLTTAKILERLNAIETSPWGGWHRSDGFNARDLSKMLRPYGIAPKVIKIGDDETARGYLAEWFTDSWSRYVAASRDPIRNQRNQRNAPGRDVTEVTAVTDDPPETDQTPESDELEF